MHLFLLGVSHRTTPVELREQLDFATRGLAPALAALAARPAASEAVVVSTCNRAEIYVACDEVAAARADVLAFLAEYHGVTADALTPHLYESVDAAAAQHLFRVAGGLDSLVVGEPQILGQVKAAYSAATEGGTAGPVLNKVFPWSFTVGKRVRTETALSEGAVSVSFAATSLAKKIFGDLAGRTGLVIGAGEMGKLTAQHLKAQGVGRMLITSRTLAHATALAESIGGVPVPWGDLLGSVAHADIVITATGATLPILTRPQLEPVLRGRRNRPLFLIDIAIPRDVDPAIGDLDSVFLYNIDDLQTVVQENLSRRAAEVARAEAIVEDEVRKFEAWLTSRVAIPTVVALRQRFETIRRSELDRLQPKLAGLPPEAKPRVEEITRLLVEKLLITPTEQLKSTPDPERVRTYADALTRLFALDAEEPAESEPGRGPAARRGGEAGKPVTP
jgi:glutamyl-tRNA reductase